MRQMFTWGAALTLVLAAGNAADAQYRGRFNPYASNLYYYQMAAAQQRAYFQAALMRQQAAWITAQQRALAVRQQQQFNALPPLARQQLWTQMRLQQAFEMERVRALWAAGRRGNNMLDVWGDAIVGLN